MSRTYVQASCLGRISRTSQHIAAVAAIPAKAVRLIVIMTDIGHSSGKARRTLPACLDPVNASFLLCETELALFRLDIRITCLFLGMGPLNVAVLHVDALHHGQDSALFRPLKLRACRQGVE